MRRPINRNSSTRKLPCRHASIRSYRRDQYLCFYPMNKKRGDTHNWYALSMDERRQFMRGHGMIGRKYAAQSDANHQRFRGSGRLGMGRQPVCR